MSQLPYLPLRFGPSFRDLEPLAGKERDATLKIEEYNGKDQEKWTIWPDSRTVADELDDRSVRQLDTQFSGLLRHFSRSKPGTLPQRQPQPASPAGNGRPQPAASEDDIPF